MALTDHDLSDLLAALRAGEMTDTIRASLEWVLQQPIEAKATEVIGARPHARTEARVAQRNGHRSRLLATPAGDLELMTGAPDSGPVDHYPGPPSLVLITGSRSEYNEYRPHSALGMPTGPIPLGSGGPTSRSSNSRWTDIGVWSCDQVRFRAHSRRSRLTGVWLSHCRATSDCYVWNDWPRR